MSLFTPVVLGEHFTVRGHPGGSGVGAGREAAVQQGSEAVNTEGSSLGE